MLARSEEWYYSALTASKGLHPWGAEARDHMVNQEKWKAN